MFQKADTSQTKTFNPGIGKLIIVQSRDNNAKVQVLKSRLKTVLIRVHLVAMSSWVWLQVATEVADSLRKLDLEDNSNFLNKRPS